MKKLMLSFLGITLIVSSVSAQQTLELTATMPELVDNQLVRLYNPFRQSVDSTYVKDKSFTLSKPMNEGGSTFILMIGDNPEKSGLGTIIYLEPGKINIEGKGTGFKGAALTGDAFVSDWVAMESAMADAYRKLEKMDELNIDLAEARKLGDEQAVNSITAELNVLKASIIASGKNWLDGHLNSGPSTYLLNAVLGDLLPKEEQLAYLDKFTGSAKNMTTESMLVGYRGWIGRQAPMFSQPDQNGKVFSLADFKGKYVLLDFWESSNELFKSGIVEKKAAYANFKNKNFTIVSISRDNVREKWLQAIAEVRTPWLQLSDLKGELNSAIVAYKVKGLPSNLLIDPTGKIIAVGLMDSEFKGKNVLEDFLTKLLK